MNRDMWDLGAAQLGALTEMIVNHPSVEMLEALHRAEAVAPIVDPTTFRKYLYSDSAALLKQQLVALATCRKQLMDIRIAAKELMAADAEKELPDETG